jgi:hypothetical protein
MKIEWAFATQAGALRAQHRPVFRADGKRLKALKKNRFEAGGRRRASGRSSSCPSRDLSLQREQPARVRHGRVGKPVIEPPAGSRLAARVPERAIRSFTGSGTLITAQPPRAAIIPR